MDKMKHRRLQELDHSDFEIVDGEPDIRGWDVKNAAGKKIGEVEDLIIDAQLKKVRYMVVDLDKNNLDLDHRKIVIPIGLAELHKDHDDVLLPGVETNQLMSLPAYDKDKLDEEAERRICSALGRTGQSGNSTGNNSQAQEHSADFYQHDYFNDDNLYKHRLHEAQPAPDKKMSDYERGLRLWEKRSEGGLIPEGQGSSRNEQNDRGRSGRSFEENAIDEEARMEMVRNRRNSYQERRGNESGRDGFRDRDTHQRRDNSIERRIRDEGLQEG
jgi:hypothetical protein